MANITKKTNPANNSTQYWESGTDLDDGGAAINAGDVFRIEESLGRPANNLRIVATGAISIKINSYYKVHPPRAKNEFFNSDYYQNFVGGGEYHDTSIATIPIAAASTFTYSGGPICNIELVTMAGAFTLLVD